MQKDSSGANDTPAVTVIDITEPTAVNEGIELLDQEAVQLEAMPLRARRVIVRLGAATVVLHSCNRRLRTATRVHAGLHAYVAFGPRAHGTINGLPVRPGLLLSASAETEARFVVEPGWETITFLLSLQDVHEHLAARQRRLHLTQGI
jgi:hypothetical protein